MQPCTLEIEFYRPDRVFRTGETVQGWVRVSALRTITCRGLHLSGYWKTSGVSNATQQNFTQQTLFQGSWTKGQKYEYPFEITPPLEPLSYQGKLLGIEHFVSARADVTWAQPPSAVEPFQWEVGTQLAAHPSNQSAIPHKPMPWRTVTAVILSACIVLLALQYSWAFLFLLLVPLCVLGLSWANVLSSQFVRDVTWSIPQNCLPEESLESELEFSTRGSLQPRSIALELNAYESIAVGNDGEQRTYQQLLHRESIATREIEFTGGRFISKPQISVPSTQAYSLKLLDNQIVWKLNLTIRLPLGIRHKLSREILVRPRVLQSLGNPLSENPNPAFETGSFFDLLKIAKSLVKADESREVPRRLDQPYAIVLNVQQQSRDEHAGLILKGTLPGSTASVILAVPHDLSSKLQELPNKKVEQWSGTAVVTDFQNDARTIVLEAIS